MSGLELQNISKRYGEVVAVEAADLSVPAGTFVCLLGPSGCGKTTLLRIIAGLEEPTTGDVVFDGRRLTEVPVHERDFGMVFQSLALFPHLTVGENIAYPLKIRGTARGVREARVAELLDLVQLPGVGARAITQLSGGQRQRVAIARALAVSPKLFLLDEPLSALDAKLREAMQVELRQLQQRLGITTIVVTHDQREAMTMADRIVVMSKGRIQQVDSPIAIYLRPANAYVADFLGQTNILAARRTGGGVEVVGAVVPGLVLPQDMPEATLSLRPEDVMLYPAGATTLPATIDFVRDMGSSVELHLTASGTRIVAQAGPASRHGHAVGETVSLGFDPAACTVFPASGAGIAP